METFKKLFLLFLLMSFSSGYAVDYCATARSSASPNTSYTLNYTCRNVSGTTYEMKLEFANTVSSIANANIGANPGPINVAASPVWSNGNKTLTYTFTAASTPSLYVATIFVIISGVEVRWDLPTNANFAATCGGGGGTAPTITFNDITKTVGDADFTLSATSNSAGAITYVSGNTGIVTISGNTAHIVAAGTTTITANQVANGSFTAGSKVANITVNAAGGGAPATAAPTPPARNSWDVISLYSGAYTTLAGVVHQHGTEVSIAGNATRYYDNMLLSRMAFAPTNFTAMTTLHADVYCPTIGTIWLQFQGGSVTKTITAGGWVSLDIPLTDYPGVNFSSVSFFDFNNPTGAVAPADNVYVDNVYFYRPATTQPPTLGAFTVPTKNLGDADFTITPPTSNSAGAWSYSSSNTNVATIVSGNMIHVVGGGTSTITATQAANGIYGQGVATATFTVNYPDPPASPTQPARSPGDVISIFASAYSDIGGTNFNPNWGQSTNYPSNLTTPTYGGDQVKRYLNSGTYQGTNFTAQNVTVINKLHVDIYSYTMTSLRISLITEGVAEAAYTVALTPNSWNSINIDINSTNFPGVNLASVNQIKYDQFKIGAAETGGQVLIIDNLYFYRETNVPPTIGALTVGPNVVGDADYAITPPTSDSAGAWSYSSSNTDVATIVSGNMIHIVGAGTSTITATQAANGIYASGSTMATLTVDFAPLTTAAPTPPARNPWDVISLYSSAYAPYSELTCQNLASTSDVQLEGNDTKMMTNFNIEIFTFTAANLTPMTTLHMDVYSNDCTAMNIWLLNNGDRNAQITLLPNQWNSINIPMTAYTNQGLNPNGVFFIKFESLNGAGKTVYFDNLYFFRPATELPPTLSNFSIPTKAYNDTDFVISPPTSDSAGAFTYSSSNTNVATIVNGNMIHIVGGGTSTITANQAADGGYGAGSITAQFNVTFAPPVASPIPPARTPDRVFSLFTGNPPVYANSITAASAPWSGATMTEVPNGTNTALQLDNFGFLGLTDAVETHFDVSGMSHLHLDIYLNEPLNANPALSRINVFLLANGDYLYPVSNLAAGWNSISIPMTNFSAADLTTAWGLKLESINPATQIYIDNVYFSNECYTYYADSDSDTYGNPAVTQSVCDGSGAPAGYVANSDDCDDTRNSVHPGAVEVGYNLIDDDCDGSTDEGFTPITTVIQTAMCNSTLASIDSPLTANLVAGAQGYRWRITTMNGPGAGQIQTLDTQLRTMKLTQLVNYAFNTQYQVEISVRYTGFWQPFTTSTCTVTTPATTTSLTSCGQTLTGMSNVIYANIVPFAAGYRFRITDPINASNTQTIERNVREFRMNLITGFAVQYGKLYNVEVSVKNTDGTWLPFGTTCNVTTPVFPTTSLQDAQCDNYNVPNNATQIFAISYPGAIAYAFQLSGSGLPAPIEVVKSTRTFNLNDFAGQLMPGATYNVKVRLIFNVADPAGPYGKTCSIVTPGLSRMNEVKVSSFDAVAFPNPFLDSFNINVTTSANDKIDVKVYDMTGRLLENKSVTVSEMETLSIGDNLPTGVYNMIVGQGDDVKTLRVIKR